MWYGGAAGSSSIVWSRRVAITIDNSAASASGDVNVTIPKGFDDFWDVIDASGEELRVVSYDSQALLAYSVDDGAGGAFSRTNRTGRIQIDTVTLPASASVVLVWLYYGSTSTQGSAAVATTITSAKSGYIELGRPSGRRYRYEPSTPNLARPRAILAPKRAQEDIYVWVDVTRALSHRTWPGNGARFHEELYFATMGINVSGSDASAMYSVGNNRFVFDQQTGQTWLKVFVTAGSSGDDATLIPDIRTILPGGSAAHQRLVPTAGLHVRNLAL
jgi:hypothetical protein